MWLLSFIPDSFLVWVINIALIGGASAFVLGHLTKWIPFAGKQALILRLVGLAVLIPALYFKGGYGVEMEYRARIAEMQAKIEIAEQKSQEENVKIVTKIETETKIIKQDTQGTLYLIEQMKEQINRQGCELTPEVIDLYNEGITGRGE